MQTFYDVTLKFSASLHVTSNTYYHEMCEIQTQLQDLAISDNNLLSTMAASMKKKYNKYWGNVENINCLLFDVVVFDNRFKLQYVKWCFVCVYDVETAVSSPLKLRKPFIACMPSIMEAKMLKTTTMLVVRKLKVVHQQRSRPR